MPSTLQQFHGNCLGLQIVVQTVFAQFATNAGVLVATEGCLRQDGIIAIDPNGAGIDAIGKLHGLVDVVGDDAGGEAVLHIVGTLNHLIDGAELEDGLNGSKDLKEQDMSTLAEVTECVGSTSSWAMRMSSLTSEKTVGSMK